MLDDFTSLYPLASIPLGMLDDFAFLYPLASITLGMPDDFASLHPLALFPLGIYLHFAPAHPHALLTLGMVINLFLLYPFYTLLSQKSGIILQLYKVLNHLFSVRCHNGFRMKLDSEDRILLMPHCHNLSVCCDSSDFQTVGNGLRICGK